jgi:HEAT repeat protein
MDKKLCVIQDAVAQGSPQQICASLQALGQRRTPERVQVVEELLLSSYESVQSVAAQTLAELESSESLPALRALFTRLLESPRKFGLRGVVATAIGNTASEESTAELVGWFLSLSTYGARFELLPMFARMDAEHAIPVLRQAWASADSSLKHSILVAASELRSPALIGLGLRDSDPQIREIANGMRPV